MAFSQAFSTVLAQVVTITSQIVIQKHFSMNNNILYSNTSLVYCSQQIVQLVYVYKKKIPYTTLENHCTRKRSHHVVVAVHECT